MYLIVRRPIGTWFALMFITLALSALCSIGTRSLAESSTKGDQGVETRIAKGSTRSALVGTNAGDLDQTFGESGKTTVRFFGSSAFAYAAALQPDGKIIAAGGNSTTRTFSLARFLTDGSLDGDFGTGGRVTTGFNPNNDFAFVQAVVLQPDGKIIAGGLANNSSGVAEFALARYLADGSLDSSFGSSGRVTTGISGSGDQVTSLRIQPDGKIVAVGGAGQLIALGGPGQDFAIVRYNPDGTLDTGFGSAGKVITDFSGLDDRAQAVAIQPDAKILVAGWLTRRDVRFGDQNRFALVRYNSNGTRDTSFGSSGTVITSFNSEVLDCQAFAMALQPDDRIVVAGWSTGPQGGADFALARYNTDGTLDTTFGSGGKVTTDFLNMGNERVSGVSLQPDGKIVVAGFTDLRASFELFALARYNPDGSLDNTFGEAGKVTTAFFPGGFHCRISAIALQPDGKIVAVGFAFFTNGNHFALARYNGADVANPTPTPTPTPNPSPTPTPAPLQLLLSDSGPLMNQVAALDSVLFLRDPFRVVNPNNLLSTAIDPNTRVVIFVRNLQLLQGESSSSVTVRLVDSGNHSYDVAAEDVRPVLNFDFTQVIFRLPDHLPVDDFTISVIAHTQVSNSGVIRIR